MRERVSGRVVTRGGSGVVLFVHGAGTPAEVAFDVPSGDFSWMGYLANAGFDVFSMDVTGYGRSTRPTVMNDPCNLARNQQGAFVPSLIPAPCAPTYPNAATTIATDWNDIGAVMDYVRALRHVDRVSMVAWSLGGPRAGGYAAQHPDQVQKLVLLAPAYNRTAAENPPAQPAAGTVFNTQSHDEFVANWARQVGCPDQFDQSTSDTVWAQMLASDPVGATWGTGVRRAPQTTTWGWNAAMVGKTQTPTLMVAGVHDKQVRARPGQGAVRGPRRAGEDLRRPRLLLTQRDVGSEPHGPVPRVARMADAGHGQRGERRNAPPRLPGNGLRSTRRELVEEIVRSSADLQVCPTRQA